MLEEAEVGGQPKELAVPIQISFEADRLSAQPGCNSASGGYTLEDNAIVLGGPLAQTMMACEDQALVDQDAWFASVLEARPTVSLDDGITLTTDDAVLRGRVVEAGGDATAPVTADDLAGRAFVLEEAEEGGAPKELAVPIQIAFEADRLDAQPGCNGASGGYTMDDGTLTLSGPLAQTMMMCADEALVQQDAWFASVLEASPQVALDGDAIVLTTDDTDPARPRPGGRDAGPAARGHALDDHQPHRRRGRGRRGLQRALDGAVAADLRARRPSSGQHRVRRRRRRVDAGHDGRAADDHARAARPVHRRPGQAGGADLLATSRAR